MIRSMFLPSINDFPLVNNRPIPDKVQVRQVVRQLIGRVVMQERRERLGMPKIERESEV
jgi:hypothetical protein